MKHQLTILALALIAITGFTSCASSGASGSAGSAAPTGNETTLNKPLAAAHDSALHALATIGATVKQNEAGYVEGRRPNKMGLMVGSGGETVKIWLTSKGANQTAVRVKTEKSIVGIVGQKSWDSEVLAAMR